MSAWRVVRATSGRWTKAGAPGAFRAPEPQGARLSLATPVILAAPTLALSAPAIPTNWDLGVVVVTCEVTRGGFLSLPAVVQWQVTGYGSAPVDASHFESSTLPSGTLNFAPDEQTKTLAFVATGGAGRGFRVQLSDALSALITTAAVEGLLPAAPASNVEIVAGPQFDFVNGNYATTSDSRTIASCPAGTLFIITDIGDARSATAVIANGGAMTKRWESGGRALWSWTNESEQSVAVVCSFSDAIGWHSPAWFVALGQDSTPTAVVQTDNGWVNAGETRTHPALTVPANGIAVLKVYGGGTSATFTGGNVQGANPAGDHRIVTTTDTAPAITTSAGGFVNWLTFVFQKA